MPKRARPVAAAAAAAPASRAAAGSAAPGGAGGGAAAAAGTGGEYVRGKVRIPRDAEENTAFRGTAIGRAFVETPTELAAENMEYPTVPTGDDASSDSTQVWRLRAAEQERALQGFDAAVVHCAQHPRLRSGINLDLIVPHDAGVTYPVMQQFCGHTVAVATSSRLVFRRDADGRQEVAQLDVPQEVALCCVPDSQDRDSGQRRRPEAERRRARQQQRASSGAEARRRAQLQRRGLSSAGGVGPLTEPQGALPPPTPGDDGFGGGSGDDGGGGAAPPDWLADDDLEELLR